MSFGLACFAAGVIVDGDWSCLGTGVVLERHRFVGSCCGVEAGCWLGGTFLGVPAFKEDLAGASRRKISPTSSGLVLSWPTRTSTPGGEEKSVGFWILEILN